MYGRMYDDVRADVQMSWARMYSGFAWVYTDVRADVRRCARGCTEELGADVQRVRVDIRRCARSNLYIRIALFCTF